MQEDYDGKAVVIIDSGNINRREFLKRHGVKMIKTRIISAEDNGSEIIEKERYYTDKGVFEFRNIINRKRRSKNSIEKFKQY